MHIRIATNADIPELTTVTPLSKGLAMTLFVLLPFIGFYIGMIYEQAITTQTQTANGKAISQGYVSNVNIYRGRLFTFDFPRDWKTINGVDGSLTIEKEGYQPTGSNILIPVDVVTIYVRPNVRLSLNSYYQNWFTFQNTPIFYKNPPSNILISGIPAYQFTENNSQNSTVSSGIISVFKEQGFNIEGQEMSQENYVGFQTIVKTLKFL